MRCLLSAASEPHLLYRLVRLITFELTQRPRYIHQRYKDGQTGGRLTTAIPCFAYVHRAVKKRYLTSSQWLIHHSSVDHPLRRLATVDDRSFHEFLFSAILFGCIYYNKTGLPPLSTWYNASTVFYVSSTLFALHSPFRRHFKVLYDLNFNLQFFSLFYSLICT